MGVLIESWCFCKGVGKSEKMKAAIFSGKGSAMATISSAAGNGTSGTGFLIHRNLLLTAHVNIPSVAAAESSEIRLHNGVAASLVPHRFFITSSVLDLTIVGLDDMDGDSSTQGHQPHYLKTCSKPNLDLGSVVYILGYTEKEELTVFKSTEADNIGTPSSSNTISKTEDQHRPGCSGAANIAKEETLTTDPHAIHVQGILTPEIYESRKLTAAPIRKNESAPIQLLDINFPPKVDKATVQALPDNQLPPNCDENHVKELLSRNPSGEDQIKDSRIVSPEAEAEIESTGSVNGAQSEVQSSSCPIEVPEMYNGYSSEGETMYSAETAESRNYPSPREGKFQHVGRSQSCVSHNRWGTAVHRNPVARRTMLEQQRSFIHGRKMHSQGATSQRSNDYFSPTVSSRMKKRNNLEPQTKPKPSAVHSSPRWMF
ncbi:conserved hypothetical protein [Ricinus communis]|uniref:Peptidase S1 domain-containing protein n=1 Tax=Ricinus communis TaxID=3988 RepID=B9T3C1_RICCO|nr:conserved hypothetical protein [Ricinus communis]